MNFDDLLKAWPSLYQCNFYESVSFCIIHAKDYLISIRAMEMRE
jgi:hypothetical protein